MKRNMNQWIEGIINSGERFALPIMTYPGLSMANKGVMEVITNGEAQFECVKALAEKYPAIAAVTVMDLSLESEAFGSPISFSDKDVPTVTAKIVSDEDSVKALKVPSIEDGRIQVYIRTAQLAAENIKDRPAFGGHIGPISLAGRLFDMTEMMMALVLEPETVHMLLEKCTQFLIEFSKAYKQAGANGVVIAEPAAGLLSPQHCTEFSSNYVKRIVDSVQDENFMVILHNCGNTKNQVTSLLSTGAKGLHFGNAVDMADILPQVPVDRVAFGNIDPATVFRGGTVEEMKSKVTDLLNKMAGYKNFVLSSGCDVPPGTPIENVDAFYGALVEYNSTSEYNTRK